MKHILFKIGAILGVSLGLSSLAHANAFVLDNSTATIPPPPANTTSGFYQVNSSDDNHPGFWESGSSVGLYSFTTGGDSLTGWWVNISFDGNPQPLLESAFMKAGPTYLWWDSTDLAAFNAGTFDSIKLIQNGIWNNPHNALLGISHAGINGTPGEEHKVPDSGTTMMLLGLSLTAIAFVNRRRLS
jgi:hypothetical protein